MELTIYTPQDASMLPEIKWNYQEIKQFAVDKAAEYKNIAYTDDDEAAMRKDRADLNNFNKALDAERIRKKKEYMAPYEAFEAQVKDVQAPIKEAITVIDKGLNEIVQKYRTDKKVKMQAWYKTYFGDLAALIPFEKTIKEEFYNKGFSDKKLERAYKDLAARIEEDLESLEGLPEKHREQAKIVYVQRLSVSDALAEGKRLAEIEKAIEERRKKQEEAIREQAAKAQADTEVQGQAAKVPDKHSEDKATPAAQDVVTPERLMTISFKATGTRQQLMELSAWMRDRGIQFGKVE